jgi:hypothetical protein
MVVIEAIEAKELAGVLVRGFRAFAELGVPFFDVLRLVFERVEE